MTRIAVLGTGMAGFGAGHALEAAGMPFVMYDRNPYYGGHTHSLRYDSGFVFDEGGHVSFTKHAHVRDILAENVKGEFEERRLGADNYWKGLRVPHPVQCNLSKLPPDLSVEILTEYASVFGSTLRPDASYAEWLVGAYGKTFASTFPMVYGHKYHTTTMDRLTTDWIGPRMYRPSLEEVFRGAIAGAKQANGAHYVDMFRYPRVGGFKTYLAAFADRYEMRLDHKLVELDPKARTLRFADGKTESYDRVVSSIPLPELIPLIARAPDDVRRAAKQLAFTTAVLINLGIDRADVSDAGITYFYDEDIIFSRVNLPHMFSPRNAPPGCGTIQAEVYFSDKYRPVPANPSDLIERVIADLRRADFIRETDKILLQDVAMNRYANVIYDVDRPAAVATVHGFLNDVGIHYCGRYGDWNHAWTDQAFISGEEAAKKALDRV